MGAVDLELEQGGVAVDGAERVLEVMADAAREAGAALGGLLERPPARGRHVGGPARRERQPQGREHAPERERAEDDGPAAGGAFHRDQLGPEPSRVGSHRPVEPRRGDQGRRVVLEVLGVARSHDARPRAGEQYGAGALPPTRGEPHAVGPPADVALALRPSVPGDLAEPYDRRVHARHLGPVRWDEGTVTVLQQVAQERLTLRQREVDPGDLGARRLRDLGDRAAQRGGPALVPDRG
jgi:hypothetical protein